MLIQGRFKAEPTFFLDALFFLTPRPVLSTTVSTALSARLYTGFFIKAGIGNLSTTSFDANLTPDLSKSPRNPTPSVFLAFFFLSLIIYINYLASSDPLTNLGIIVLLLYII